MEICIFDAQAEATQLWQELCSLHALKLRAFRSWCAVEEIPNSASLLIFDQSVVASGYETELLRICRLRPYQMVVATGPRLSVKAVVELLHGGVGHAIEKPLQRSALLEVLPEILEAARRKQLERQEFQLLAKCVASLTGREKLVLDFVLGGVSNKQAAERLKVSVRTVESRRAKVYRKLEATNVAELIRNMHRLQQLQRLFQVRPESAPADLPSPPSGLPQPAEDRRLDHPPRNPPHNPQAIDPRAGVRGWSLGRT